MIIVKTIEVSLMSRFNSLVIYSAIIGSHPFPILTSHFSMYYNAARKPVKHREISFTGNAIIQED